MNGSAQTKPERMRSAESRAAYDRGFESANDACEKKYGLARELITFAVIGVLNTAIDLAVLNSLIAVSHRGRIGLVYSLFKAVSFLVALVNSYFMNRAWTFPPTSFQTRTRQLGRFFLVSVAGLVINVAAASSVANLINPTEGLRKYWPSVAALVGTLCGLAFNFAGYKYLVFSSSKSIVPDLGQADFFPQVRSPATSNRDGDDDKHNLAGSG